MLVLQCHLFQWFFLHVYFSSSIPWSHPTIFTSEHLVHSPVLTGRVVSEHPVQITRSAPTHLVDVATDSWCNWQNEQNSWKQHEQTFMSLGVYVGRRGLKTDVRQHRDVSKTRHLLYTNNTSRRSCLSESTSDDEVSRRTWDNIATSPRLDISCTSATHMLGLLIFVSILQPNRPVSMIWPEPAPEPKIDNSVSWASMFLGRHSLVCGWSWPEAQTVQLVQPSANLREYWIHSTAHLVTHSMTQACLLDGFMVTSGIPRRHWGSGLVTLPSVGAIP